MPDPVRRGRTDPYPVRDVDHGPLPVPARQRFVLKRSANPGDRPRDGGESDKARDLGAAVKAAVGPVISAGSASKREPKGLGRDRVVCTQKVPVEGGTRIRLTPIPAPRLFLCAGYHGTPRESSASRGLAAVHESNAMGDIGMVACAALKDAHPLFGQGPRAESGNAVSRLSCFSRLSWPRRSACGLHVLDGLGRDGHVCHQVSLPAQSSGVDRTDPTPELGVRAGSGSLGSGPCRVPYSVRRSVTGDASGHGILLKSAWIVRLASMVIWYSVVPITGRPSTSQPVNR